MKIFPKKSLGQNFLIDEIILNKIAELGEIKKFYKVIEVGPGTGNLTEKIIQYNPKELILVEKDKRLIKILKNKFNQDVKIINEDILNCPTVNSENENIVIFGNLPYNISTQILVNWIRISDLKNFCRKFILLFQKEVADRIIAKTKTKQFGRLSVLSNWRLEIKKHFDISRNCFFPKPKINSTLLSFTPKKNNLLNLKNPKNLEKVTRILFSNRRKMINKNFKKLFKDKLNKVKNLNIDLNKRPEELNNEIFYKITIEYERLFG